MRAFCILAVLPLFISCQRVNQADSHTLSVGLASPPTTLDPRRATDAYSQRVSDLLFSALVRMGPELRPIPEAARSWVISEKKMTFALRDDLKFANGRSVTCDDIIYSFSQFQNSSTAFSSSFEAIASVECPDSKTLILRLKKNDASLISNLNLVKILPKEIVEKFGDHFTEHPEGSGPYQFVSLDNNQLALKINSYQSYAAPKMENIVFKFVRDENTRYLKMIKGDLDVLLNEMQEEKVTDLQKSGKLNVLINPGLNFNFLVINFRDSRLKNLKVREALFASLNRSEIVKYKLENLATVATSIIAPISPFSNANLKFPEMTLEEGKRVIQQAGLKGTEINLLTSDQGLPTSQILAQQIEQLGIKINLRSYEWGTFYSDLKSGNFQLATSRMVGIVDPDVYRDTLDSHQTPPTGRNRGFYINSNFDGLVEKSRSEINFEKRKILIFKAEQLAADDMAIIPLWYNSNISILNPRVKNFIPMITGSFFPFFEVAKK